MFILGEAAPPSGGSGLAAATQAEQETGTSVLVATTPGRQHFHPSAAKFWGELNVNGTVFTAYNITSVADGGAGIVTVTIATDFSSADWACLVSNSNSSSTLIRATGYDAKAAGSVVVQTAIEASNAGDPTSNSGNASWSIAGFGDHA
jgi:subtilase family serine protease